MVVFNYSGAEINAKVVYYGPALSGKTTNLEHIYKKMPANSKGKMVSMKTRTDRTLFFDFLPLELGEINGYRTRILLYTVPGQVYYNATRKLVLKGADAVVFVADSGRSKLDENVESLRNLEENLNEHGLTLDTIPWVIQYNKRDVPDALPIQTLASKLNLLGVPSFEAVASTGRGIYETFQAIASSLYAQLVERLKNTQPGPRSSAPTPAPVRAPAAPAASPVAPEADGAVTDLLDNALREMDVVPKSGQKGGGKGGSRGSQRARASQTTAPSAPPAQPARPASDESLDRELQFVAPAQTSTAAPDIGRVVEFEDIPPQKASQAADNDFIVRPFQSSMSDGKKEPVAAPVNPPSPAVSTPLPPMAPAAAAPVAPVAPPREEPEDGVTLTVPVVLTRSQMHKNVPIRIELEIQVDEDES
jgi:signal recognition particle receptor subunit beta